MKIVYLCTLSKILLWDFRQHVIHMPACSMLTWIVKAEESKVNQFVRVKEVGKKSEKGLIWWNMTITSQHSWDCCASGNCKCIQNFEVVHNCKTRNTQNVLGKFRVINEKARNQENHLSESKTNCWFDVSLRALANNRLSASTIDILPHTTCRRKVIHIFLSSNWMVEEYEIFINRHQRRRQTSSLRISRLTK